ncbi:deoxyribose-phosphate aldolase [Salinibaculum salinum]|uniref:deoxyribose-phosphate aldolase n=1 Tax=Salinibaculum salinum TaxID=3131996 RepID=UPI0030EB6375
MNLEETLIDSPEQIVSAIEHTNVDPTATEAEIRDLCQAVHEYDFRSAVVVPYHAQLADELLGETANVVAVVGFPYGIQNAKAKQAEVTELLDYVDELDMVMNRTAFANDDNESVVEDISAVKDVVGEKTLKCIIESPALSPEEIRRAATLAERGGADFVKTAVGYDGPTDKTEVEAIQDGIGPETGIKASGGISRFDEALEMVRAGATRIGTSSGVEIYESIPERD